MVDTTLTIAGQAGQGVDTAAELAARALARSGYHVFAYPDVMSRIRGGHNFTAVRAADRAVLGPPARFNLLLALDRLSVDIHRTDVVPGGTIVADDSHTASERDILALPLAQTALEVGGNKAMTNVVGLGSLFELSGHPLEPLLELLSERFAGKGDKVVKANVACARAGAGLARKGFRGQCNCRLPRLESKRRLVLSGNQAMALGAIAAGVRFHAGYPMSPSTPVMELLAERQAELGLVVEQAEDEIGALNMVCGAAYAGVRAMTATSGGGFALMTEALGLAGMAELPIVVIVAQRTGPATGFPTRNEQGELLYCISASQDEFPRFVLAPGTAEAAFSAVQRAFELAWRFHVPAIVLSDQLVSDSLWTMSDIAARPADPGADFAEGYWQARPADTYKRYADAPDGVSPLLRPGFAGQVVRACGSEHDEAGFQVEDAPTRKRMQDKRLRKLEPMRTAVDCGGCFPGQGEDTVIACWGGTYGAVREAVEILQARRVRVGMLHLDELEPFPRQSVRSALALARRVITVEANSAGQLARLLAREVLVRPQAELLKFDGRPFAGAALADELQSVVEGLR
ncbi:MAG: 2-oxoacid:acceptor oxidoreductase subunit alpha [bacterium]